MPARAGAADGVRIIGVEQDLGSLEAGKLVDVRERLGRRVLQYY